MVNEVPTKLRVLIDANLLFAGTGWPRFPYAVLQHAVKGDYQLVLSHYIVEEARNAVLEIMPHRLQQLEQFLQDSQYEEVAPASEDEINRNESLVRDVKDVPVALAAMDAQVDFLVTQDKDLTDPAAPIHQHIKVLLPGTFLREHMGWTSEALEAIRKRNWADMED